MRLLELDPRWLLRDGRRIGFIFYSPVSDGSPVRWRQTCFFEPTRFKDQCVAVWDAMADQADGDGAFGEWQSSDSEFAWTARGKLDFATLTVTPSIDGSKGRLWHGHVTDGQMIGGL